VLEPGHGQGVLRPDIDVAFVGARGNGGDQHAFDHQVWVAFHDAAVHEGPRIPFVTIADDVFGRVFLPGHLLPFATGRIAAAAPAAQIGFKNRLANRLWRQFE